MSLWAWLRARPAAKPAPPPHVVLPFKPGDTRGGPVPEAAVDLIARFEGFGDALAVKQGRVKSTGHPYRCPAGKPTIGYGATFYPETGKAVTMDDPPVTEGQARLMLRRHVVKFAEHVDRLVKVPLNAGERGALVSFVFNFGPGALAQSTLLKKLNAGDKAGAADEFQRWNRSGSSILEGLTRRRAAEAAMFRGA